MGNKVPESEISAEIGKIKRNTEEEDLVHMYRRQNWKKGTKDVKIYNL